MRIALLASLCVLAAAAPSRADALRRTVAPMMRADGDVCDLLRAQVSDRCKRVASDGAAAVYQSGSKQSGVRRLVLAITAGDDVLVSPPIDVLSDELESTTPTLRSMAVDGHPGIVLDVVSTWKRGARAEHTQALVGCTQADRAWRCALVEVGACDASVGLDGSVTTACGSTSTLAVEPSHL